MKYLLLVFEIIFSPLTYLFRVSIGSIDINRTVKPVIVVSISIITIIVLILFFYRVELFN